MGLRATIATALGAGFTALGDIKKTMSYKAFGASSSYNPDTSALTTVETTTTITGVVSQYDKREIDGESIRPNDQKILLQQSLLSAAPTINDRVVIDGISWAVIDMRQDPAGATWTLQVRTQNG